MDNVSFKNVSQQLDVIFENKIDAIDTLNCGGNTSLNRIPNRVLSKYLHNKWKTNRSDIKYSNAYRYYTKKVSFPKRMSAFVRSFFKGSKDLDNILKKEVMIEKKSTQIQGFLSNQFDKSITIPEKSLHKMSKFSNQVKDISDPVWLSIARAPLKKLGIANEDIDDYRNKYQFAQQMNMFFKDLVKENPDDENIKGISDRLDKQLKNVSSIVKDLIANGGDTNKIDESSIDEDLFRIVLNYYNAFVESE